jgi:hypothetical protein
MPEKHNALKGIRSQNPIPIVKKDGAVAKYAEKQMPNDTINKDLRNKP